MDQGNHCVVPWYNPEPNIPNAEIEVGDNAKTSNAEASCVRDAIHST